MDISIIIITHAGRTWELTECLQSILDAAPPGSREVIAVVNGHCPDILQVLSAGEFKALNIRYLVMDPCSYGQARNKAVRLAEGETIFFFDDDIAVDKNIFEVALKAFTEHPDVAIIGGPNLTPPSDTLFQECTGLVFASVFGSAPVRHRYQLMEREHFADERWLISCNLAIKKRVFDTEGVYFAEDCLSNEENILLYRLQKKGYAMLFCPRMVVFHHRRRNLRAFAAQVFKYGRGRMQQTLKYPASLYLPMVVPSVFCLYLLSLPFWVNPVYLLPLGLYAGLATGFSVRDALRNRSVEMFFILLVLYPVHHIAYGTGFLAGIVFLPRFLCKRKETSP